ncbi:TPA: hypothetical protein H1V70_004612 [Salmonella enterica]|nr:hypothetical protein [Salmonella enterica]
MPLSKIKSIYYGFVIAIFFLVLDCNTAHAGRTVLSKPTVYTNKIRLVVHYEYDGALGVNPKRVVARWKFGAPGTITTSCTPVTNDWLNVKTNGVDEITVVNDMAGGQHNTLTCDVSYSRTDSSTYISSPLTLYSNTGTGGVGYIKTALDQNNYVEHMRTFSGAQQILNHDIYRAAGQSTSFYSSIEYADAIKINLKDSVGGEVGKIISLLSGNAVNVSYKIIGSNGTTTSELESAIKVQRNDNSRCDTLNSGQWCQIVLPHSIGVGKKLEGRIEMTVAMK